MTENNDKINQLLEKLEILLKRQNDFAQEISNLQFEINKLKSSTTQTFKEEIKYEKPLSEKTVEITTEKTIVNYEGKQIKQELTEQPIFTVNKHPKGKSDLEKFIGENLINKIGIAITVIGVAIGAKYAIDHELISPLTRIILGYMFGIGLLGIAIKLKQKYESFSAVLLSGSMAIMYFITYAAYSFYGLIPQVASFFLMVIFTMFTVIAAISYNRQVIAHIGLVGAYAVPFLLSEGSGRVSILFTYMAIINIGILVIAIKKYWKSLHYSAFGLTWLIYSSWYLFNYQANEHFGLAFTFLILFFLIFYLTFVIHKLLLKEQFEPQDIILLLANSFVFYGIGYTILDNKETSGYLGLYTLLNAVIHFLFSAVVYRQRLADKNMFYLITGLTLVFITIAIPVQLDGNWVTLLWAGEAALLFWIGRTRSVSIYETLSYPLMILAFFSITHDWTTLYNNYYPEQPETKLLPLLNANFLSSLLFISAFVFINVLNRNKNYSSPLDTKKGISPIIDFCIPAILIVTLYYAFRMEIEHYWNQLYTDSFITINQENEDYSNYYSNYDLKRYRTIWVINYSLLFVSAIAVLNFKKIRSQLLGLINLGFIVLALIIFLVQGLYILSELRESYLEQSFSAYYHTGVFNIGIRYISIAFVVLSLIVCYNYTRQDFMQRKFQVPFDFLLYISALWIASSELINWMNIAESAQSYKLGLSIFWGIYSLFLISLGIWKKKKHLRIGAIVLFGATLIKLFFYDISHLNTISKTIVLVSLGILLLIISFLYNKYKHIISNEIES